MLEHMPSQCKTLSSNPSASILKREKKKKKKERSASFDEALRTGPV
jgi:hypothetical protein